MTDLIIDLPLTDDGIIEGPEEFAFGLSNPSTSTGANIGIDAISTIVTTTINDTQGDGGDTEGPGEWSVTGSSAGDEGSIAQYTVSLSGAYGAGEIITVDLELTDVSTNASDYADIVAAITDAIDGNPDVTFDPVTGTLSYTAPVDGATMTDLIIDLPLIDDGIIEGPEEFTFGLSNPSTSTGANIGIDAAATSITTTVNDTQGDGGATEGPGEWSVAGTGAGEEGSTAQYTVSLSGAYGAGAVSYTHLTLPTILLV